MKLTSVFLTAVLVLAAAPLAAQSGTCFATGQSRDGGNIICRYSCLSGPVSLSMRSGLCPRSLDEAALDDWKVSRPAKDYKFTSPWADAAKGLLDELAKTKAEEAAQEEKTYQRAQDALKMKMAQEDIAARRAAAPAAPAPAPDSLHGADADKCRSLSGMPYYVCMHPVAPAPAPAAPGAVQEPNCESFVGFDYDACMHPNEPARAPATASKAPSVVGDKNIWKQVLGSRSNRVLQLVGAPSVVSAENGVTTWYYENMPSGTVTVYFVNDVATLTPPRK
jgi:hypothetical protein